MQSRFASPAWVCPPSPPQAPPGGRSPRPCPAHLARGPQPAVLTTLFAAAGTAASAASAVSALSVLNPAVALPPILEVTTPLRPPGRGLDRWR